MSHMCVTRLRAAISVGRVPVKILVARTLHTVMRMHTNAVRSRYGEMETFLMASVAMVASALMLSSS